MTRETDHTDNRREEPEETTEEAREETGEEDRDTPRRERDRPLADRRPEEPHPGADTELAAEDAPSETDPANQDPRDRGDDQPPEWPTRA